jgi:hypothetical protein
VTKKIINPLSQTPLEQYLPGLAGSPPASQELARTPERIILEKQPRRDQGESNRGTRPGVRAFREAQQPQTSGDQKFDTTSRPGVTGEVGPVPTEINQGRTVGLRLVIEKKGHLVKLYRYFSYPLFAIARPSRKLSVKGAGPQT